MLFSCLWSPISSQCCSLGASAPCFFRWDHFRACQLQQPALLHILKARRFKLGRVLLRHKIHHCRSLRESILPLASPPRQRIPPGSVNRRRQPGHLYRQSPARAAGSKTIQDLIPGESNCNSQSNCLDKLA